jgi:uncharacterized protein (UPF0276 family)
MTIETLPALGVGLGFRPTFRSELFLQQDAVDFLEVTTEHYLDATPEKWAELELLQGHYPLIPHGLNLSLGSAEGIDLHYLDKIAAFIDVLSPAWWSEHICFTRAGGIDIGHLSPVPFHQEALDTLCRNIEQVQSVISVPLILENITYAMPIPGSTMTEAEFLSTLLAEANCGLLLDVTNLYTNATNHEYDPIAFLEALPVEKIVQLHFVGGMWQNGLLLDTHSSATPPEVWALLDEVLARMPVKGMILERDENIPAFSELAAECARARELGHAHARWSSSPRIPVTT